MSNDPAQHNVNSGSAENMGSLEKGLSGEYQLIAADVIREAWGRVSGNKGTIWLAVLIYFAVFIGLSVVFTLLSGGSFDINEPGSFGGMLKQLLVTFLTTPLWVGITFIGIAIASNRPAKSSRIISWYGKIFKLFITYIIMMLMIALGLLLLVLPGIYLMIAYLLALPLVADKDLGPWEALETSRKAITHRWFTFFGLWFVAAAAMVVSIFLAGIPMIWLMPTIIIGSGILYRNTFGVETASLEKVAG